MALSVHLRKYNDFNSTVLFLIDFLTKHNYIRIVFLRLVLCQKRYNRRACVDLDPPRTRSSHFVTLSHQQCNITFQKSPKINQTQLANIPRVLITPPERRTHLKIKHELRLRKHTNKRQQTPNLHVALCTRLLRSRIVGRLIIRPMTVVRFATARPVRSLP